MLRVTRSDLYHLVNKGPYVKVVCGYLDVIRIGG